MKYTGAGHEIHTSLSISDINIFVVRVKKMYVGKAELLTQILTVCALNCIDNTGLTCERHKETHYKSETIPATWFRKPQYLP